SALRLTILDQAGPPVTVDSAPRSVDDLVHLEVVTRLLERGFDGGDLPLVLVVSHVPCRPRHDRPQTGCSVAGLPVGVATSTVTADLLLSGSSAPARAVGS